ncbi:MAG: LacI family DNA-binding transcriptional regulator [Propionibacteriaceae bacterium]|nr:LacI family DNA-binding transcriptional regulator [Propionibacteriaceae bacterium]
MTVSKHSDFSRGLSPTMTDVARAAQVSQSCVSPVLNNAPGGRIPEA